MASPRKGSSDRSRPDSETRFRRTQQGRIPKLRREGRELGQRLGWGVPVGLEANPAVSRVGPAVIGLAFEEFAGDPLREGGAPQGTVITRAEPLANDAEGVGFGGKLNRHRQRPIEGWGAYRQWPCR